MKSKSITIITSGSIREFAINKDILLSLKEFRTIDNINRIAGKIVNKLIQRQTYIPINKRIR